MSFYSNKTVLVINDNPDHLNMMVFILQRAGYDVLTAADGRQGWEIARSAEIDLIISDVMMPEMSGIELTRLIRADEKLRALPLMLVSALQKDADSVTQGLDTGADDYLEVPFEPMHLIARTARLIERKRMEDLLRESEQHFRSVTENVSDVISIISMDGTIIYGSPSLEPVLGFKPQNALGKNVFDLIHRDDKRRIVDFFYNELRDSATTSPVEYRFKNSDGGWRNLESIGKFIDDPQKGRVAVITSRDVTRRRQIEFALRESENRLQTIFDNAAIGIAVNDLNGFCLHSNPALQRMLGYSAEELRNAPITEFTHPDDVQKDLALAREVFAGSRESYQIEKRYFKKNGELMWGSLTVSAIPGDEGGVNLVIGMVEDITDRKFAEAALRESEERFKAQYKGIPIPTYTWKKRGDDFVLVDFNIAAEKVPYSRIAALLGISAREMYDDMPDMIDNFNRCFDERTTIELEKNYRYKTTGEVRKLDLSFVFAPPDVVMVHARDITEQYRAEKSLRESEEKFRKALDNSRDVIYQFNLKTKSFDYMSQAAEAISGYPAAKFIDKGFAFSNSLVHPDDLELLENEIRRALTVAQPENSFHNIEYRLKTKDKGYRWISENRSVILDENDDPVAIIATGRDVTEQKEAASALHFQKALLESQSEASIDGILVVSPDRQVILRNRRFVEMWSISAEALAKSSDELILKSITDQLVDPDQSLKTISYLHENSHKIFQSEIPLTDGRIFEFYTAPVKDDQENYYGRVWFFRDISERKRADRLQRQNEEWLAAIFEASQDGIVVEENEKIVFVNQRYLRMYGFDNADEVIGSPMSRFQTPEDSERMMEYGRKRMRGEQAPIVYEFTGITKTGKSLDLEASISTFTSNDNFYIVTAQKDIAERKKIEREKSYLTAQIEKQRQRLDSIVGNIPGVVWEAHLTDSVDSSEFVSDYVETMTGYTTEEWLAVRNRWFEIIHPGDRNRIRKQAKEFLRGSSRESAQFRWICKDGSIIWVETQMVFIRDDAGRPLVILGVTIDITQRKKAEESVREADHRALSEYEKLLKRIVGLTESLGTSRDLQSIFRSLHAFAVSSVPCSGLFISLYNAERDTRNAVYACSDGEEIDVSGFPEMQMSGSPNSRAISSGSIIIENDFQSAMKGKPVVNVGLDKNPDLPQSCLVAPMTIMGRMVGAVEVQSTKPSAYGQEHATALQMAANLAANAIENVRLLEQEREKDEQLRQAQKLESVGRLAGGIAHDFNNMLTAINGYSDLLLRKLKGDDPMRQNIEEIKKAGERSASLTQQLLAFSRQQILQTKLLDLNEVILDTSNLLQRLIGEDVELRTHLDFGLDQIKADPGQLVQVIMNLAVNARDAMPDGGVLSIETKNVRLDEELAAKYTPLQPGQYVLLSVKDTGIGIDEQAREHIFEPFYTTKGVGEGTGLGLATVYGIVKQSGGHIKVESEVGIETTFEIYLPSVKSSGKPEEMEKTAEESPMGTGKILLVEDEDMVRNLSREVLEACGYEVLEAANGVEALRLCEENGCDIDLLMTDVVMPQMGGRELAEKLVERQPGVKVLFTSGYTDDLMFRHGINEKEMNFIQKPFTFDGLAGKIRRILEDGQ